MAREIGSLTTKNLLLSSGKSTGASGKAALPTSDPRSQASCSKCDKLTEGTPHFCNWLLAEIPPGLADDPDCEGFGPLGTSKGKNPMHGGADSALPKANKKRVDKPVTKPASEPLPPIGGNYERPKAKSTDRHRRETRFQQLPQVNAVTGADCSVTTWRRLEYVVGHGSPELVKALDDKKISISRAYNIVKAEEEERARQFLHDFRCGKISRTVSTCAPEGDNLHE